MNLPQALPVMRESSRDESLDTKKATKKPPVPINIAFRMERTRGDNESNMIGLLDVFCCM
jgi:hypothetical protein